MRSLVIYVSHSGNTRRIAEAIGDGLRSHGPVDVIEWSGAMAALAGRPDLVVLGGPTERYGVTAEVRSLFEVLPPDGLAGTVAASFDTRLRRPTWLSGSAAKGIGERLRRAGAHLVAPPESFFVTGTPDLKPGELERARAWGASLGRLADTAREPQGQANLTPIHGGN